MHGDITNQMNLVAEALTQNPAFREETARGARVTGNKVREKYLKIVKACRDADQRKRPSSAASGEASLAPTS